MRRGLWSKEEDEILINCVNLHGHGKWRKIANNAGLKRSGKSCRLRWLNYLSPYIKRGDITVDEEDLIIRLHQLLGNRWSMIAGRLPGRTDNEIKNYWNTTLKKKYNVSHFSSRSSNKTVIIKSGVTTDTREDTQKALVNNNNTGDKMVSNLDTSLLPVVSPKRGDELETNYKVIPSVDGMIFLPSENDSDFLADINGGIGFGCCFAQGSISWEDDAKLLDFNEFDKELNKLASFLDLDED